MRLIVKQSLSIIAFSVSAFSGPYLYGEMIGTPLLGMTLNPSAEFYKMSGNKEEILADSQATSSQTKKKGKNCDKWPMFNPNSVKNSNELWVDAEVLFWQSHMGSLDYGITSNSTTTIGNGRVKNLTFDWDWGFRLGLGYKLPHDKWDLFVKYTYVHGRGHGHTEGGSDHIVFPQWASNFGGITPFYANSARAHWSMNLNMGDIELGRTCTISKWLTIRPFLGVRGLVIDQDYNVKYTGGTVAPADIDKVHMDTDYWGVGLRMGADTLWGLGRGFSIYGNGSFSLLSSDFNVHEHEKHEETDLNIMSSKRDINNVVVTADLALGVQWDYMFSRDRFHFGFKLGWEFDMFFDQNQLFNFLGPSPGPAQFMDDDLSFQGLTLGFRFDF